MHKHLVFFLLFLLASMLWLQDIAAQTDTTTVLQSDSLSTSTTSKKKTELTTPISYAADDSIVCLFNKRVVQLYNNATVNYEGIQLTAYFIELDLENHQVFARQRRANELPQQGAITHSSWGKPLFNEGNQVFEADTLRYNLSTKKGLVEGAATQQGDGYLYGERTKKVSDSVFYLKQGKYTTCTCDPPHFYFQTSKAKVVSNKKIITGPTYLVIEDFPLYLPMLPFGYFPNQFSKKSGVILPTYGEERIRGFFIRDGGYYWHINDNWDLAITGGGYTNGSWAAGAKSNYKKRYRYQGTWIANYAYNILGEKNTSSYSKLKQMSLVWQHKQDPKANPTSNFSASVDISSATYNRINAVGADYTNQSKASSITYYKKLPGTPVNITSSFRHAQRTTDSSLTLVLPEVNISATRMYPFRSKNKTVNANNFLERIAIGYTGNLTNNITTKENKLTQQNFKTDWQHGAQHIIPITLPNLSLLKHFTLTPTVNYKEQWIFNYVNKTYDPNNTYSNSLGYNHVKTDTIFGFKRSYEYNYNLALNTNIYGFYEFKNRKWLQSIRHRFSPTVTYTYQPDFGASSYGFWQNVQTDALGNTVPYSLFENSPYGAPTRGKTSLLGFSLFNNLEAKMRNRKTNRNQPNLKKVNLLNNLTVNGSYNFAADSVRLNPISLLIRNNFNNIQINANAVVDPYLNNSSGTRINTLAWDTEHGLKKLGRLTYASLAINCPVNKIFSTPKSLKSEQYQGLLIPTQTTLNYFVSYSRPNSYQSATLIHTLGINSSISLTTKWQVNINANVDLKTMQPAYTSITILRDLHCWSMALNFVPIGFRKSYSFQINIKAASLQDLRVRQRKNWTDNAF